MPEPFLAMITPLTGTSGGGPVDPGYSPPWARPRPPSGPVDPGYGVDAGLRPTHPIVIPPDSIGPGVPTHPIYLPVYPSHPIVIPPGSLGPGLPTHPIYLPVYPAHPIVIPPDAVGPGLPTHPIVLPPTGPVDPGYGIDAGLRPVHPIYNPPYPDNSLPPFPSHPIVIPPEAIIPDTEGKFTAVVYYNTGMGVQRITFGGELPPPTVPVEPTPKPVG